MQQDDTIRRAHSLWQHRGQARPPFAEEPSDNQESVWDYPRPPAIVVDSRLVRVMHGGRLIAETSAAVRILETASPPTFYIPATDVQRGLLRRSAGSSLCEWKGMATYCALAVAGASHDPVGWSYEKPQPDFEAIAGYFSFYPGRVECTVDGERVRPQPGHFYGGWITDEVVGPFKGEPGTAGW